MFNFTYKSSLFLKSSFGNSPTHYLFFLQCCPLSSSKSLKPSSETSDERSFTVSYLINSFGFSQEKALSASKYCSFQNSNRPDAVVAFLMNHGFTQKQISKIIRGYPRLLLCDPAKTILPKIQFFTSVGVLSKDLGGVFCSASTILTRSLVNQLIPSLNMYKQLLKSDEKIITALKTSARFLCADLQKNLVPNVQILQDLGMPETNIRALLMEYPKVLLANSERITTVVEELKEMRLNPQQLKFIRAMHVLCSTSKFTWEKKVELYKKWGWSEDEISLAFEKYPWCMTRSEGKIGKVMDYLINKMGLEPSAVAKNPILLSCSMEKKILPRGSVYQVLLSKGIHKEFRLPRMLVVSEKEFVKHIEKSYKKEAPELLKLYQQMLNLSK